jgi:tetratricopeptide (TPR) repeat protein
MASLIPGYEYDIFISYRQKDNKGDRWVTEFVEALKTELESTFKEEVSLYFDVNPHDGLLETHDVDASLKDKLNCLIFIPVISRTYCDPNSFAWEHELKPFVERANEDNFGLRINLPNGNVASRVLPVRIHDLDRTDIKLCESVLGGMMRGVDFVYKSAGVNRPLRPVEEHPHDNINKTYYRDQINKVANSIKDIIQGFTRPEKDVSSVPDKKEKTKVYTSSGKFIRKKMLRWTLLMAFVFVCFSGIYIYMRLHQHNINEKTIAIIPMTNPPNDPELSNYVIGSMDAIIAKLYAIKSLTVKGEITSYQYLNTKKPITQIRKELNSNYLVVINISRSSKNITMSIGLTRTRNDKQLWANLYEWNEGQLMPLFTKVVQTIAEHLNINFNNQEIIDIEKDLTKSPDAYLNYLTASAGLISAMGKQFPDSANFRSAIDYYDKAIEKDPDFGSAYARRAIALSWGIHTGELEATNIDKCLSDINSASRINKDLNDIQIAYGFYYYYCTKEYTNALISFNNASLKDPKNYKPIFYMAMVYRAMGDWDKVHEILERVIKFDIQDPLELTNIGLCFEYLHDFDSALIYHQKAIVVNPDWSAAYMNKFYTLLLNGNTSEARTLLDSISRNSSEKHTEDQIMLDIYDGKYPNALTKATNANPDDFRFRGVRYLFMANISNLLNDKAGADGYFDAALNDLNLELKADTGNARIHSFIGLALAGKGKKEGLAQGERAIRIAVKNRDKMLESDMILNMAQIYTQLGMFQEAIEKIKASLKNPSLFSAKMLRLDPVWKPLLLSPELKTTIAKYEKK